MKNREEFISENLGLVHACAGKFRGRGIEYDDLFGAGCVGLCKAADGFDESRGFKFSTYAVPVILGEIKRLFREGGTVKVGRTLKELSIKASRETESFIKENGRPPQITELAAALNIEPSEASLAVNSLMPVLSLTEDSDDDSGRQNDIPVAAPEEKISENLALRQTIEKLPEFDRQLIILRYFCHKTQTQTADALSVSQVQVSRKEKKILAFMRGELI